MPNLSNCIKSNNGNTYCWDTERKRFVRLVINDIATSELPDDVVEQLAEAVSIGGEKC
jgi:hypothetical protein